MTGYKSKKQAAEDKVFDRQEAEEFLTDEDFEYIMNTDSGLEFLRDILLIGHKGYVNYTDDELKAEVKERKQMKEYL
jgi:hypothetical protein